MTEFAREVKKSGVHELLLERKLKDDIKLAIASKCELILQSPQENIHLLRELIKSFESSNFHRFHDVRMLLVASLCVIFKDIIPSYRIRPPTEQEKAQPAKKETKKVRFYEENLLLNYKKYVQLLRIVLGDKSMKTETTRIKCYSKQKWNECDKISALKCVCQLLEEHPDFNFSEDLIKIIPVYLNNPNEEITSVILETLDSIFKNDFELNVTLMICRAIHRYCRSKSYIIQPPVIKALACVPITEVDTSQQNKTEHKDRQLRSRRERKKDKLERKFEKEMAETNSIQSREQKLKMNTLVLNEILFVFFKVLKTQNHSQLLSAVLEGLSNYADLISITYVDNLLDVLNNLVTQKSTHLSDGLFCVHTALSILTKAGGTDVLSTDPTRFYNHFYTLLGRMAGVSLNNDVDINKSTSGHLKKLIKSYERSNTPAAQAVAGFVHRSKIIHNSSKANDNDGLNDSSSGDIHHRIKVDETERLTDILLSCLDLLLIKRKRDVSTNRVLAFVKRLVSIALAMSEPSCSGAMLVKLIQLLRLFPRCEVLFDFETEIGGSYRPEVNDPELCLPASACLWELIILERHYSDVIRQLAHLALKLGLELHSSGLNSISSKQYFLQIRNKNVSIDQLLLLSPKDCRIELSNFLKIESSRSSSNQSKTVLKCRDSNIPKKKRKLI